MFPRPAIAATQESQHNVALTLGDGSVWLFSATDEQSATTLSRLAAAMQLKPTSGESVDWKSPTESAFHQLYISTGHPVANARAPGYDYRATTADPKPTGQSITGQEHGALLPWLTSITGQGHVTRLLFSASENDELLTSQLVILSLIIAREVELGGGLLIHGALAEYHGHGVVLAGPSGAGKSTISRRIPPPWRSLCDDITLLVRDHQGHYWGHPWPTWSNFMFGGQGDSWDVQQTVPLEGIFFLEQAAVDQIDQVGPAAAAGLLIEGAEQVSRFINRAMSPAEIGAHRLRRFETICAMVKKAPIFHLRMSPAGPCWFEIEELLPRDHETVWANNVIPGPEIVLA